MPGKVFSSGDLERRENTIRGHQSIIIRNRQKQLTWILMPEQRMYMEGSGRGEKDPAFAWENAEVELTRIGTETVNGVDSDKFRVVSRTTDGETSEGLVWLTRENIPVRYDLTTQTRGKPLRVTMECSRLTLGPQEPGLFQIPDGYSKIPMPGMMGGMPPMGSSRGGIPPIIPG